MGGFWGQVKTKRFEFFRAYADGYAGFLPADAQYASGGVATRFSHYDYTSVTVSDTGQTSGAWHAVFETYALTQSQNPNANVISLVDKVLSSKRCNDFMRAVLRAASTKDNPALHGGDIELIFDDFLLQGGGLSRSTLTGAPYGSATGTIGKNGTIYSYLTKDNQDRADASTILNELPHIAGTKGGWPRDEYDDFALAQATHSTVYGANFSLVGNYPTDKRFGKLAGRPKDPFADPNARRNRNDSRWSNYFHNILRQECALPQ